MVKSTAPTLVEWDLHRAANTDDVLVHGVVSTTGQRITFVVPVALLPSLRDTLTEAIEARPDLFPATLSQRVRR